MVLVGLGRLDLFSFYNFRKAQWAIYISKTVYVQYSPQGSVWNTEFHINNENHPPFCPQPTYIYPTYKPLYIARFI